MDFSKVGLKKIFL